MRELTDRAKATWFSVLVLGIALVTGLAIKHLHVPLRTAQLMWVATPLLATALMMLVVTRDWRDRDQWRVLGLHRAGLRWWAAAFGVSLAVSLLATAVLVPFGLARLVRPADPLDTGLNFLLGVVIVTATFGVAEELAFRGYLLPRLIGLGRNRALLVTGLVHAAWHLPLILLTPIYHSAGNRYLVLPLFVGTIVAAGFVFGDLRFATGSVWPASIAHAVHNVAWDTLLRVTVVSSPLLVNEYLAGDNGVLILAATAVAAVLLRLVLRSGHRPAEA